MEITISPEIRTTLRWCAHSFAFWKARATCVMKRKTCGTSMYPRCEGSRDLFIGPGMTKEFTGSGSIG